MKLNLRDLFWLALFIASLTVWAIEHRKAEREISDMRRRSWIVNSDWPYRPSNEQRQRLAAVKKFARFTDDQLDEHLATLAASNQFQHHLEYEPCLAEMARRGMSEQLQKHYNAYLAKRPEANQFPFSFPGNLELLTALRRAQNKPDPLRIQVELADRASSENAELAPQIRATITNADIGKEAVSYMFGGDYRGGRRERWRLLLTDEQGWPVADSNFQSGMGGGIFAFGYLEHGRAERESNAFDLRRYVSPPRSGKYQLQVLYHNQIGIAGEQNLTGLIVSKSDPIWITVNNLDEAESQQWPMRPHPALAILAACGFLIAASFIRPPSPRRAQTDSNADDKQTANSPLKISRRDLGWTVLIVAVALGFWLDHRRQERRIERSYEDAKSRWTITRVG